MSLEQATSDELRLLRAIVDSISIDPSLPDERYAIAPWSDPQQHSANSSRENENKFVPDELDTLFEDYVKNAIQPVRINCVGLLRCRLRIHRLPEVNPMC